MPKQNKHKPFYDFEAQPKLAPGTSLPKLPGISNQKEFAEKHGITKGIRKQYLNAQAQYAGYSSYYQWMKAREGAGVKRTTRDYTKAPDIGYKDGDSYIFEFEKAAKTGLTIPNKRQYELFAKMNKLIRTGVKNRKYIQIHFLANTYSKANEQQSIQEWTWASTALISIKQFRTREFKIAGESMLAYFYDFHHVMSYTFPPGNDPTFPYEYSKRMGNKTILGFKEVHITAWNLPGGNHKD